MDTRRVHSRHENDRVGIRVEQTSTLSRWMWLEIIRRPSGPPETFSRDKGPSIRWSLVVCIDVLGCGLQGLGSERFCS